MKDNLCRNKLKTMITTTVLIATCNYVLVTSDNVIIGTLVGETAVGGVGLISPLNTLIIGLTIAMGGSAIECVFSESCLFNKDKASAYYNTSLWLATVFGLVMFFFSLPLMGLFLHGVSPTSLTYIYAEDYYSAYIFVMAIYPVHGILQMITFAEGNERLYITSYGALFIVNLVVSATLCMVIGVAGCPLGTIAGIIVSSIILIYGRRRSHVTELIFTMRYPIRMYDVGVLLKCLPGDATLTVFASIFTLALNQIITFSLGESYLAIMAVVNTILGIAVIFESVGFAMCPMLFMYISESNHERIRNVITYSFHRVMTLAFVCMVIVMILAKPLAMLLGIDFTESSMLAIWAIRVTSVSFLFAAPLTLIMSFHGSVGSEMLEVALAVITEFLIPAMITFPMAWYMGPKALFIGLLISSIVNLIVTHIICTIHLRRVYKREAGMSHNQKQLDDVLMLTPYFSSEVHYFDFPLEPESIIDVQQKVEALLNNKGVSRSITIKTSLLIEEVYMLVKERNENNKKAPRQLIGECSIIFDNHIILVLKDNGKIFDITDADLSVSSLRSYTVSSLMEWHDDRSNMVMMCCNRNAFGFEYEW